MVMRVRTRIGPSPIHGLGLFAAEPIRAGQTVWEWDEGVDLRLPMSARDAATGPMRELLTTHAWVGEGTLWLPADGARHVNHSSTPNCAAGPGAAPSLALRDIAAGEELTEDYGEWDEEWGPEDWGGSAPAEPEGPSAVGAGSGLLTREAEDWRDRALLAEGALAEAAAALCCEPHRVPEAAVRAVSQGDGLGHELARVLDERDIAREELANSRATTDYLIGRVDALSSTAEARFSQVESLLIGALDERDRLRAEVERLGAALASLLEASRPALRVLDKLGVDEWSAFDDAVTVALRTLTEVERLRDRIEQDALERMEGAE
jgi:hypothetical protein